MKKILALTFMGSSLPRFHRKKESRAKNPFEEKNPRIKGGGIVLLKGGHQRQKGKKMSTKGNSFQRALFPRSESKKRTRPWIAGGERVLLLETGSVRGGTRKAKRREKKKAPGQVSRTILIKVGAALKK